MSKTIYMQGYIKTLDKSFEDSIKEVLEKNEEHLIRLVAYRISRSILNKDPVRNWLLAKAFINKRLKTK